MKGAVSVTLSIVGTNHLKERGEGDSRDGGAVTDEISRGHEARFIRKDGTWRDGATRRIFSYFHRDHCRRRSRLGLWIKGEWKGIHGFRRSTSHHENRNHGNWHDLATALSLSCETGTKGRHGCLLFDGQN
jgi:hypothetical protein